MEAVAGSVPVIVTSVVDRTGLDELLARIGAERTLALVGESGVGKSSIVNALVGEERLEVGEVRASDAEGRHTTTARELIRLPGDAGLILDTPGIRTLGLWEAEHASISSSETSSSSPSSAGSEIVHTEATRLRSAGCDRYRRSSAMRVDFPRTRRRTRQSPEAEAQRPGGRRVAGAGVVGRRCSASTWAGASVDLVAAFRGVRRRHGSPPAVCDGRGRFPVDSEIVERRWCARIGGHDDEPHRSLP